MSDTPYEYIHDPAEIYRQSFDTVRNEPSLDQLAGGETGDMAEVAVRLIHSLSLIHLRRCRTTTLVQSPGSPVH